MVEKIQHPSDRKRASKNKTKGGIKALITCGDLGSLLCAAKKWYKIQSDKGVDCSKLLHHIANAEAVFHKYNTRNANAFDLREKRRTQEEADELAELEIAQTSAVVNSVGDKILFDNETRQTIWGKLSELVKGK